MLLLLRSFPGSIGLISRAARVRLAPSASALNLYTYNAHNAYPAYNTYRMGSTTGAAGLKGRLATSIYNDLSNSQEDTSGQTDHDDVGVVAEVDVDVNEDAEPEEKYPKVELSLDNGFTKLGLYTEIARSLAAQQITEPTPVQVRCTH
jgi:hypothetical protein